MIFFTVKMVVAETPFTRETKPLVEAYRASVICKRLTADFVQLQFAKCVLQAVAAQRAACSWRRGRGEVESPSGALCRTINDMEAQKAQLLPALFKYQ